MGTVTLNPPHAVHARFSIIRPSTFSKRLVDGSTHQPHAMIILSVVHDNMNYYYNKFSAPKPQSGLRWM
ncbi:hypothetical protein M404DRAFT_1005470 [Pisolithus tinctorius Marx 270]|uniref:Uncharacterized protein n=1 Tax=Pisolithus tinctorius Marx 270 TaxID=870435 RepID=A0A0C3NS78_PISTI|nr:hypothetical protein M404DRAFT_1005470 [Pisolithus tinctorius Marx 270]